MKLQIIFRISLFLGAFATMALSNAVVPVLNSIASDPAIQGAVYSAYFLGAFLMVFPAGWMSDRVGRTPLVRAGLCGTLIAAAVLWLSYPDPTAAVLLRFAEGLFTGMFVSAAMAFVNSAADHRKLAGGFVALMNIGMVAGLVVSGWLLPVAEVTEIAVYHKWLWAALFVFCGTTGVVISAYPELSGSSAEMNGVITALMSVATAVFVYAASRMRTADSLSVVRGAGIFLGVSVPIVLVHPAGMIFVGAAFGVITAAILNYLAETKKPQGVMNGMFNMTQYAGMAALPFAAGLLVLPIGYVAVFLIVAVLNAAVGLLVVRCPCYVHHIQ